MSNGVRFIWDFHGPDAEKTATHHQHHLGEFLLRHGLDLNSGTLQVSEAHYCAYIDTKDRPLALDPSAADGAPERTADQIGRTLRPNRFEELEAK